MLVGKLRLFFLNRAGEISRFCGQTADFNSELAVHAGY